MLVYILLTRQAVIRCKDADGNKGDALANFGSSGSDARFHASTTTASRLASLQNVLGCSRTLTS